MLGITLPQLLGPTLFAINEAHVRAVLGGESVQFERFLTKPDGNVGHVLANYIPDLDEAGKVTGFIIVVADIKAFKIAEAELKLASKVYASMSEAVLVTDGHGHILSVNPAFTDITGFAAHEAIGQTPALLHSHRHAPSFHEDVLREVTENGLWRGEMWSRRKTGEVYLEWKTITRMPGIVPGEDRYVSVFYDITESWEKNETIKQQAFHDALTNLPNRLLLRERIERHVALAARETRRLAVMFLDLDHFKAINDAFGHATGDELLVEIARRLQGLVREADTVARLGGDEFVVMLDNPASEAEVALVAARIIDVISQPLVLQGQSAQVGASVGIALYPNDGATATALLGSADQAMYAAKREGRNSVRFAQRATAISAVAAAPEPAPAPAA
jgi:diguanylate cyclase (GGDEF)-like protein/PAS domain S-box-containing protein